MIEQARQARDKLLTAGLTRSQFSVRTEQVYKGKKDKHYVWGQGEVKITLKLPTEEQITRIPDFLLAGLSIMVSQTEGEPRGMSLHDYPRQTIEVMDVDTGIYAQWFMDEML